MGRKTTYAAIAVSTFMLGTGAMTYLTPRTADEVTKARQEQQLGDAADAQENVNERTRAAGKAHLDAELSGRNLPVDPAPDLRPRPKIRLP